MDGVSCFFFGGARSERDETCSGLDKTPRRSGLYEATPKYRLLETPKKPCM